ncbi:MAG: hypothetical protein MHM6MM_007617 [Cercozoa sp. M6MM]
MHVIPRRLRAAAAAEVKRGANAGKEPQRRTRKYRRRKGNALDKYARRSQKHQWLETHIWHAKRAHMANLWGYKLADRCAQRGARACHRASTSACSVFDASFWQCLEVSPAAGASLSEQLRQLTGADETKLSRTVSLLSVHETGRFPRGFVSVVQCVRLSERLAWLFVHPAACARVKHLLSAAQLQLREIDVNRFELRGRQTPFVLQAVLRPREDCKNASLYDAVCANLAHFDAVLTAVVQDPQKDDPVQLFRAHAKQLYPKVPRGKHIRAKLEQLAAQPEYVSSVEVQVKGTFFDDETRHAPIENGMHVAIVGTPHDDVACTLLVPEGHAVRVWRALQLAGARFIARKDRRLFYNERARCHFPEDAIDSVAGCMLHTHERAVQQMDFQRKPESKRPNFAALRTPFAFGAEWHKLVHAQIALNESNEVAYFVERRSDVLQRFPQGEFEQDALVCVQAVAPFGHVGEHAMLALPTQQDVRQIHEWHSRCQRRLELLQSQEGVDELEALASLQRVERFSLSESSARTERKPLDELESIAPLRQVIGFASFGHFSWLRGRGFALCYAHLPRLAAYCRQQQCEQSDLDGRKCYWLLLRNPTSRRYVPVQVSVLADATCY